MKPATVCLILWFSVGAFPLLIGRVTAQRKPRPKGLDGFASPVWPGPIPPPNPGGAGGASHPEAKRARQKPAILQSAGKRSSDGAEMISLSDELDTTIETGELVMASKVKVPELPKEVPTATTVVAPAANSSSPTGPKADSFRSYMKTHQKKYYAQYRAERRRSAFMDNLEEINEHNREFEAGKNRFRLAPNAFADMPNSEYRKRLIRLKTDPHRKVSPTISDEIVSSTNELPESLDWREKGFKTAQANQKSCGSCYAFSVAYALSAQLMKHIGRVELVSEQQMVDCSTATGNLGCGGGSLRNTLKYLEQAGGVMRQVDYPYTSSLAQNINPLYAARH